MQTKSLTLLPILAIAVSCGGSSGGASSAPTTPPPAEAAAKTMPDNSDILSKVYDTNYSVPQGFFVDERARTETRSYTVHHVLDQSRSFEVCTNDMTEATTWESADNASRSVSGQFVTIHETDRYFEFVRELSYDDDVGNVDDITSPGYARVFKCDHTNRSGVDRNLLDGFSGVRNAAPMTALALQDFAEYLWQFRFFNVKHKVVLDSYSEPADSGLVHNLLLGLVHSQGTGNCDRIELAKWQFSADLQSGEIIRSFVIVRDFEAQHIDGIAKTCQ